MLINIIPHIKNCILNEYECISKIIYNFNEHKIVNYKIIKTIINKNTIEKINNVKQKLHQNILLQYIVNLIHSNNYKTLKYLIELIYDNDIKNNIFYNIAKYGSLKIYKFIYKYYFEQFDEILVSLNFAVANNNIKITKFLYRNGLKYGFFQIIGNYNINYFCGVNINNENIPNNIFSMFVCRFYESIKFIHKKKYKFDYELNENNLENFINVLDVRAIKYFLKNFNLKNSQKILFQKKLIFFETNSIQNHQH